MNKCQYYDTYTDNQCTEEATAVVVHPRFTYDFLVCFSHGRRFLESLKDVGFEAAEMKSLAVQSRAWSA